MMWRVMPLVAPPLFRTILPIAVMIAVAAAQSAQGQSSGAPRRGAAAPAAPSPEARAADLARRAAAATDSAERTALISQAETAYRGLLAESSGGGDEAAQLRAARRRAACATVIFRLSLAPLLDQFERSSGLAAPRDDLRRRLDEAIQLYRDADGRLETLNKAMARDEERFLLLGIAAETPRLARDGSLNLAWALAWRGAIDAPDPAVVATLSEALRRFDDLLRAEPSESESASASLGAAIALRLLQRPDDALRVLDDLAGRNPPPALAARIDYERARTLIAAERFQPARDLLTKLSQVRTEGDVAPARFYVELSEVLLADCDLLEANRLAAAESQTAADLRRRGAEAMARLFERGPPWPPILRAYLVNRGARRDAAKLTPAEMTFDALQLMREQRHADAAPLWRKVLEATPAGPARAEPLYNLGLCLLQTAHPAEAADRFEDAGRLAAAAELADSAALLAFRARLAAARTSHARDDFSKLAAAAQHLLTRAPKHPETDEITWVRAIAFYESGRPADARAAYEAIPLSSPHGWEARRNVLLCRAALTEAMPEAKRAAAAGALARDWLALADHMSDALKSGDERVSVATVHEAQLSAADLFASDRARAYSDALSVIARLDAETGLTSEERGRLLSLRIRCHRGLDEIEKAAAVLDEFIRTVAPDQVGDTLIGLAAGMEAEIQRLDALGRDADTRRVARSALPTLRELLAWVTRQPARKADLPLVQLSLLRTLERAGQIDEALAIAEPLHRADPRNGAMLAMVARLTESKARAVSGESAARAREQAERLWAELLSDASLRDTSPADYWEARYAWLRLRLEAGHAAEVARAIESEQAWQPALGGAPWQGRLLDLAEQARSQAGKP